MLQQRTRDSTCESEKLSQTSLGFKNTFIPFGILIALAGARYFLWLVQSESGDSRSFSLVIFVLEFLVRPNESSTEKASARPDATARDQVWILLSLLRDTNTRDEEKLQSVKLALASW